VDNLRKVYTRIDNIAQKRRNPEGLNNGGMKRQNSGILEGWK
jgi:hypothetical protein